MKVRDLLKALENEGWKLDPTKGSHRQYRHPQKPALKTITVDGHPSEEVPKGILTAISKQAKLKL